MHCCAAIGEAWAAEEALEETKDKEAGEVVDESGGDGEDDEEEECDGVDGTSTDTGNFAQGGEEKRSNTVGKDVKR